MLFDTHAHLNFYPEERVPLIIQRAREAGVKHILCVGIDLESSRRAVEIASKYEGVLAAVGIHPHDSSKSSEKALGEIASLAREEKVVAIGETGLDFYRDYSPREIQRESFLAHIKMAKDLGLPLVVHSRKALQDSVEILTREKVANFIMHCFSGTAEETQAFLKMGGFISLAGPVTFKNARKTHQVAKEVPLEKLLLETDAPYLTPHPYRGKENEPFYLKLIAQKVAEIKGCSFKEVSQQTTRNALNIFSKGS